MMYFFEHMRMEENARADVRKLGYLKASCPS